MGQKVNPISFRTQLSKKWKSRWFAGDDTYADFLLEDIKLRKAILDIMGLKAGIADIEFDRNANDINIFITTSRPGVVIGRGGSGATDLKVKLQKLTKSKVKDINIEEIRNADTNAKLVADSIVTQLERRMAFRRAMRQSMDRVMKSGAKGVKIMVSGRLNGADIARQETISDGTIPLQTIKADVDYAYSRAKTTYGILGIKVWIYQGREVDTSVEVNKPVESIVKGK